MRGSHHHPAVDVASVQGRRGEPLGFFCLVNARRDAPVYPTEEDVKALRKKPEVAAFLDR